MAVEISLCAELEYQSLIKTLETSFHPCPHYYDRLRQRVNDFISDHQTFPVEKLDELKGRVEILRQNINYHEDDSDDEEENKQPSCCLISTALAIVSVAAGIVYTQRN